MATAPSPPRVTAVLGPTNTGKTYLAIERMLGHGSGMIGFPLRLLARENYDRVVALRGARQVALVTGEEKIVPPQARYFLCTVESMPLDRRVDFLAVDEVQLAADADRGHVFTDRLLRARGEQETMLLGSDTIRPLLRRLVPEAEFITRPRFSTLRYAGPKKVTRLPRRSAVIAFSAADVYSLAELMRRHKGGAAVVLGALSPRARNAQVGMFQSGEVDHLIATDAIGMGLNMDIDHVAFARLWKFDGRRPRRLDAAEIAQIAGRAGRHMSDGTFGTTSELGPLDPETVAAVEEHKFPELSGVFWRNADLDCSSLPALLASLDEPPRTPGLLRARAADDHLALVALSRDSEVLRLARGRDNVRLLWEVCQIPDYRKILSEAHTGLLRRVYGHLAGPRACLPEDWVANSIARLDRTDGDIDTLATRIAHVRTWTYIAYRGDWLADSGRWQETTRAIEDKLSDALHERLTQRFVDRRSAILISRLKDRADLVAGLGQDGTVTVEGETVGRLEGFRFLPAAAANGGDKRALVQAARRALRTAIAARLRALEGDADSAFGLAAGGKVAWRGVPVARLKRGPSPLSPQIEALPSDLLETHERERLRRRTAAWLEAYVAQRLAPLLRARSARLSAPARGIVYRLCERLGAVEGSAARAELARLSGADREALRRLGVRMGAAGIFLPALYRPAAVEARAQLWAAHKGSSLPPLPASGAASVELDDGAADDFYWAVGFRPFRNRRGKGRALRLDRLERLVRATRRLARQGTFVATPGLVALAGGTEADLADVLAALGFVAIRDEAGLSFRARERPRGKRGRPAGRRGKAGASADSPFAKLRELDLGA